MEKFIRLIDHGYRYTGAAYQLYSIGGTDAYFEAHNHKLTAPASICGYLALDNRLGQALLACDYEKVGSLIDPTLLVGDRELSEAHECALRDLKYDLECWLESHD